MSTPSPEPKRRTLMIVDDEEGPRQALQILFSNDYNILLADNGFQALELAQNNPIDAAVLDIRMAGMSGIELLNRLKQMEPGIEVVMLTAFETLETARQALRLGACDYLNKPFEVETMRRAVAHAMERRAFSKEMGAFGSELQQLQDEIYNQKIQEEITRSRSEIYASIIHDINGPLTIISGFVDVVNQRLAAASHLEGEDLDLVKDRLGRITRQVGNCIQVVKRYLSFLRGRAIDNEQAGLNQILDDLADLLKNHPCKQRNKLLVHRLDSDVNIRINGTDLLQVLLNLTINAFQSTADPNEVQIHAARLAEPVSPDLFIDRPNEKFVNSEGFQNQPPLVAISVADQGNGIPSEILTQIFSPYFTTKPVGEGTGLGLSIVKRLVQRAKGAIHVQTQPGHGTKFTLYLPSE